MIKVGIIGVGNCASALVQGVWKYNTQSPDQEASSGLMQPDIGGYTANDISFVVAFDVDDRKVGLQISDAIQSKPNCCYKIIQSDCAPIAPGRVHFGPLLDGVAPHMHALGKPLPNLKVDDDHRFVLSQELPSRVDFKQEQYVDSILNETKPDVLLNYLPVGSTLATEFWADTCLRNKISLVNCIPVFLASDPVWAAKFRDAGVPIIGDDMRSQFGASVLSQMLEELALARGHRVIAHIQQNVGGNTDFLNMKDEHRLASKKISKENVLKAPHILHGDDPSKSFLFAGPSDYIAHQKDNKVATFRLELEGFGGSPVTLDARLSVQDSPNSAGVVIDAIRYVQVAKELGRVGPLLGPSAFTQKTPPKILTFDQAKASCEKLAKRDESFDSKL